MGHANISVTANIYTHRDQGVLHENMAKLAAFRGEESGKEIPKPGTASVASCGKKREKKPKTPCKSTSET